MENGPTAGTCMQLLVAVDRSSCFTRDDLGGLLSPTLAEALLRTAGIEEACLAAAAELEGAINGCEAALDDPSFELVGTGCPEACNAAMLAPGSLAGACDGTERWQLPAPLIDESFGLLTRLGSACDGRCLGNDTVPQIISLADACESAINSTTIEEADICPTACAGLLQAIRSSACLPSELEARFPPPLLGILEDTCALASECQDHTKGVALKMASCLDDLTLATVGAAKCLPSCVTAAQEATSDAASSCFWDAAEIKLAIDARQGALTTYASSRAISTTAQLMRALTMGAWLHSRVALIEWAGSMCSSECVALTANMTDQCAEERQSCGDRCYGAYNLAMAGCLDAPSASVSVASKATNVVYSACELRSP